MPYISEYDTKRAIITCLEVLEIKGDNPMIDRLQQEARDILRNDLKNLDTDWLIRCIIELREDARTKSGDR